LKANSIQSKASLIIVVAAVLALLIASPALQHLLVYPQTEFFTEFWLADLNHKAENYPYNITANSDYTVYLGISNHLGSSANYQVQVKFRNQTQIGPNTFDFTSSPQPSLYNFDVSAADNQTVEMPIVFQFKYTAAEEGTIVYFNQLTINSVQVNLNGYTSSWNSTNNDFFGKLIFELWLYNSTTNNFQYNERYVDLRLNMTST
jgi:uncharacterized membrane protein